MHAYNVNQSNYDYYNSEFDEFDTDIVRFKPEPIDELLKQTKFTRRELKLMYRGFKQLCPSGVVKEDKFKIIYAQFFPRGADTNCYARFLFDSFDLHKNSQITFTDFVVGLSSLTRGSPDDQLRWIFKLYDLNNDGVITRDELQKIVTSVYDLMGKFSLTNHTPQIHQPTSANDVKLVTETPISTSSILTPTTKDQRASTVHLASKMDKDQQIAASSQSQQQQLQRLVYTASGAVNCDLIDELFKKFDLNNDGLITIDEFLVACQSDEQILSSLSVFNTVF